MPHSTVVLLAPVDDAGRQDDLQLLASQHDAIRGTENPWTAEVEPVPVPFAARPRREIEERQERVVGGACVGDVEHVGNLVPQPRSRR